MARLWLFLAAAVPIFADGGMVLLRREVSPFVVTVFEAPTPPRVGAIDLSVLLQSSETLQPVLNAEVRLDFIKGASRIQVRATRNQASNKLLHAASVRLDGPGEWHYSVLIDKAPGNSTPINIPGVLEISDEQPKLTAYWGYLLAPFVFLAVLAVHQWLRSRIRQ